jgi:hypothetical protein
MSKNKESKRSKRPTLVFFSVNIFKSQRIQVIFLQEEALKLLVNFKFKEG